MHGYMPVTIIKRDNNIFIEFMSIFYCSSKIVVIAFMPMFELSKGKHNDQTVLINNVSLLQVLCNR